LEVWDKRTGTGQGGKDPAKGRGSGPEELTTIPPPPRVLVGERKKPRMSRCTSSGRRTR